VPIFVELLSNPVPDVREQVTFLSLCESMVVVEAAY
jgi:hypothetical protein